VLGAKPPLHSMALLSILLICSLSRQELLQLCYPLDPLHDLQQ
jgi:hypothetical protein